MPKAADPGRDAASIPPRRRRLIAKIERIAVRGGALDAGCASAYYHGVDEEELERHSPAHWVAVAELHRRCGLRRPAGKVVVRVFNPEPAADGFESPHTCVFIVADDTPFLLDSLGMVFDAARVGVHLVVHPVLGVRRGAQGVLRALGPREAPRTRPESWQFYTIDRQPDTAACAALQRQLESVLHDVWHSVSDWQAMRQCLHEAMESLAQPPRGAVRADFAEARALLEWMDAGHFIFLGYRHYRLERGRATDQLRGSAGSGLGILRPASSTPRLRPQRLGGSHREMARAVHPLLLTKADSESTVHRAGYLDYVGVKTFDARGRVSGEHRFLGLWASTVYQSRPQEIPVLRRKVEQVVRKFNLAPQSHDARALVRVLGDYPRDELFQASVAELVRIVRAVVNLYERRTVRLIVRDDPFGRFHSCMVYVPRDRYTAEVGHRIENILREAWRSERVESRVHVSTSSHARLHLLIHVDPAVPRSPDHGELERLITDATRTFADRLLEALLRSGDSARARTLAAIYARALPRGYQDEVPIETALADIAALERVQAGAADALELTLRREPGSGGLHLRVAKRGESIAISTVLPMLENFGLRVIAERPYELTGLATGPAWIQDLELDYPGGGLDVARHAPRFEAAFLAVWHGELENDGFNRLLFAAELSGREIMVLRACCRFLLQANVPFGRASMERALLMAPQIAALLWRLFRDSFDPALPARGREGRRKRVLALIDARLGRVESAADDRILRGCLAVLAATLRTNYYCHDAEGQPQPTLALKLDSRAIPELPQPRPLYEIYVQGPEVEGVHLRMAAVARGGLRWSDRRDDFRTEVLGLMKAQNVKNTVIVPAGAKGGFIARRLVPAMDRDEQQRVGIAAYKSFVGALLDVTDNLVRHRVVPPRDVVRLDGDDPYLVVAADKGTAGFSDIANAIAVGRGFWLGDAFASGGSAGYNHKALGITARGAWECTRRHFRELGVDVVHDSISVAGIGDMSGDVFGNGLLRSPHVRLVAAFNHLHVFLDPAPDAARSHAERLRLFRLPRSSWDDYDRRLISRGGGVWSRSAKRIDLSSEARDLLGLDQASVTPQELIRSILRMRVDLLWNGGIGTYVKARSESHADVRDRTNDPVRVDGADLRARVVTEGGNLGFTQRGRIEYALTGGRINTDFIDNSAGVNTSDFEVNIKILLDAEVRAGRLQPAARKRLLGSMADEVSGLVLRNNYLQSQAISILEAEGREALPAQQQTIRALEQEAALDRALESLPDDTTLADRMIHGPALTRPEIAIVLAYSKLWLKTALLESTLPEDRHFAQEVARYFPSAVRRRHVAAIRRHPLRRELIVTSTVNSLVNRMGPGFVLHAREVTGAHPEAIARAYTIARELFDARTLWSRIEALDSRIPATVQYRMMARVGALLGHASEALLHGRGAELPVANLLRAYRRDVARLAERAGSLVRGIEHERHEAVLQEYAAAKVPAVLARRLAACDVIEVACELADLARNRGIGIVEAGAVYYEVGAALWLDGLRTGIDALDVNGSWQSLAQSGLRHGLRTVRLKITEAVLARAAHGLPAERVAAWLATRGVEAQRWQEATVELRRIERPDFATLSAALDAARRLA